MTETPKCVALSRVCYGDVEVIVPHMAYEVVKHVGARAYRYRVDSYRDPATGKARAHWTYLGRAGELTTDEKRHVGGPGAPKTRELLVDAFERVLEQRPYARVTAGCVAREAGFAHGTFYRYFRGKRSLLSAAIERVREELARIMPDFEPPYGTEAVERARVRAWVRAVFSTPREHRPLLRAYLDALESDAALRQRRNDRQRERVSRLSRYLSALAAAGTVSVPSPEALTIALLALIDGALRGAVVGATVPDDATIDGVADVFERAIFGVLPTMAKVTISSGRSATDKRSLSSSK